MFLVVAKKSRTFSTPPCSAGERVCRDWRGHGQAGRPAGHGDTPCHGLQARFMNGDRNPLFHEYESSCLSVSLANYMKFINLVKSVKSMSSRKLEFCACLCPSVLWLGRGCCCRWKAGEEKPLLSPDTSVAGTDRSLELLKQS